MLSFQNGRNQMVQELESHPLKEDGMIYTEWDFADNWPSGSAFCWINLVHMSKHCAAVQCLLRWSELGSWTISVLMEKKWFQINEVSEKKK